MTRLAGTVPVKDRPKCLSCDKPLRPQTRHVRDERTDAGFFARAVYEFSGHYGDYGDDAFCGVTCGYRYARALLHKRRRSA